MAGGVVTATPLTSDSRDSSTTGSGRSSAAVASSPAAPAATIPSPTSSVPRTDQCSDVRAARKPKTMKPAELSPNAYE